MVLSPAKRSGQAAAAPPANVASNASSPRTMSSPRRSGRNEAAAPDPKRPASTSSTTPVPAGIYLRPSGRWAAQFRQNGKHVYLGLFDSTEEAVAALEASKNRADPSPPSATAVTPSPSAAPSSAPDTEESSTPDKRRQPDKAGTARSTASPPPVGVYMRASGRWSAGLTWKGEKRHLGTFDTAEQATAALADAKRRLGVPLEAPSPADTTSTPAIRRNEHGNRICHVDGCGKNGRRGSGWMCIAHHRELEAKKASGVPEEPPSAADVIVSSVVTVDPPGEIRWGEHGKRLCRVTKCCKNGRRECGWMCMAHHREVKAKKASVGTGTSNRLTTAAVTPTPPRNSIAAGTVTSVKRTSREDVTPKRQPGISQEGLTTSKLPIGIYRKSDGRWFGQIRSGGKNHYLGTFDTMEQAIAAKDDAKKRFEMVAPEAASGTVAACPPRKPAAAAAQKRDSNGVGTISNGSSADTNVITPKRLHRKEPRSLSAKPHAGPKSPLPSAEKPGTKCSVGGCTKYRQTKNDGMCRSHYVQHVATQVKRSAWPPSDGQSKRTSHYADVNTDMSAGREAAKIEISSNDKRESRLNEKLASSTTQSKRQPKRSKTDILKEFEVKSEMYQMTKCAASAAADAEKQKATLALPKKKAAQSLELPPQSDWKEAIDPSTGKPYYYHVVSNEVTWDKPACLAAQEVPPFSVKPTKKPKGITQLKDNGKWKAQINVAGKRKSIGHFDTPEKATAAYELVRTALDESGLSPNDEGRLAVFAVAKLKAIEAAPLDSTKVPATESDLPVKNAAVSATKSDTSSEISEPVSEWRETIDEASGKPYYYHTATQEVTWDKPSCLAAQNDPAQPKQKKATKGAGKCKYNQHGLPLGVTKSGSDKFRVQFSRFGKVRDIGSFSTPEEAAVAYQVVREELDSLALSQFDEVLFEAAKARARVAARNARATASAKNDTAGLPKGTPQKFYRTKGTSMDQKTGQWIAQISVAGRCRNIGKFDSQEEAAGAFAIVRKALDESEMSREDAQGRVSIFEKARVDARYAMSEKAKGICQRHDNGRWQARITVANKTRIIGTFATSDEAAAAYQIVREELDGTKNFRDGGDLESLFQESKGKARKAIEANTSRKNRCGQDISMALSRSTIPVLKKRSGDDLVDVERPTKMVNVGR